MSTKAIGQVQAYLNASLFGLLALLNSLGGIGRGSALCLAVTVLFVISGLLTARGRFVPLVGTWVVAIAVFMSWAWNESWGMFEGGLVLLGILLYLFAGLLGAVVMDIVNSASGTAKGVS